MGIDHLVYPERAVEYLAENLAQGTLVLFLGAGTSTRAGLPEWRTLIEKMRDEVNLSNDELNDSADSLERAAEEVRDTFKHDGDRSFAELVQKCLYDGVRLDDDILRDNLLIALGALMMGSRRGSVKRVVSFNFDSVLEWYISLYGFVPRVVLQPPVSEGSEDVRIYHPHGFLPHPEQNLEASKFVVLDRHSINLRLGKRNDEWMTLLSHIFSSGLGLFIGLSEHSFRDSALAPLLAEASKKLKGKRPTGFWILKTEEVKNKVSPKYASLKKDFLKNNIVPLYQADFEGIPKLLLRVCQLAAQGVYVSK